LLKSEFKSTWTYWLGGGSHKLNYSYQNVSQSEFNFPFCISTNRTYYTDADFTFTKDGYKQNHHYYKNARITNNSLQQSLYLLNSTKATTTTIEVINEYQTGLVGKYVQVQLYDVGGGTFNLVSMAKTNYDGEDTLYLNWYDSLYKFIVLDDDGETILGNFAPTKISSATQTLKITSETTFDYRKFNQVSYVLYYNNATGNFIATYTIPSGVSINGGCLRVVKSSIFNYSILYDTCINSASGTLSYNLPSYMNGTFHAIFYVNGSVAELSRVEVFRQVRETIYENLLQIDATAYMIILFAGIVLLFVFSPVMAVVGGIAGWLLGSALGLITITSTYVLIGFITIALVIAWKVRT
ncbi:MAG: hypothetical protein VKQ33_16635, partial [Candidatus Sericytochromatia bacterium]|nr:hypothetical protein [Candidatus Sericytochromatia bacterium]